MSDQLREAIRHMEALRPRGVKAAAASDLVIEAALSWLAVEEAEPIQRCEIHLADYHDGAPGCVFWMFAKVVKDRYGTEEPRPCRIVPKLLGSTEGET